MNASYLMTGLQFKMPQIIYFVNQHGLVAFVPKTFLLQPSGSVCWEAVSPHQEVSKELLQKGGLEEVATKERSKMIFLKIGKRKLASLNHVIHVLQQLKIALGYWCGEGKIQN